MEQTMTLGKRIAMLRRNQGWTQEQLGEKVGVSAQAVSKWENDQTCPDITTLPLLADLFGITTDELLGIKPIEPHVVILDKEPEEDKDNKTRSVEINLNNMDQWTGITMCIMAILICVMLILRSTTPLFNREGVNVWNYIWTIAVFSLGLMRVRKNIVFGITAMAIGIYEFIWFGWGVPFEIKWYVILLVFAVASLLKILLVKMGVLKEKTHRNDHSAIVSGDRPNRVNEYSDEGYFVNAELSFGSNRIEYPYDTLRGAKIETNFGDHLIDFRNVQHFENDPVLDVEVNFGNVVVYLPDNVQIHKNSDTSFGAFRVKGAPSEHADQVAYFRGEANFGNLEIRYPNA